MDGFRAYVRIDPIELTAGFIGKTHYESVHVGMKGFISACADAGYGHHVPDTLRKLTYVDFIAIFGEDSRDCGVPNDLMDVCIGAMYVSVSDEMDSRRLSDIRATLRVTLPRDFFPYFLTLREHELEVIPFFYREPEADRDIKLTKISGYGSIKSYITHITFALVVPGGKASSNV